MFNTIFFGSRVDRRSEGKHDLWSGSHQRRGGGWGEEEGRRRIGGGEQGDINAWSASHLSLPNFWPWMPYLKKKSTKVH